MKLEALRAKIDQLDNRLLNLLNERTRLVSTIGRLKLANGQAVFAPDRELNLLLRLLRRNRGPLPAEALRAIYREILSSSRASQNSLRIGYTARAIESAFAAARWRFGACDRYFSSASFPALVRRMKAGKIDVAVVDGHSLMTGIAIDATLFVCERIRDPQASAASAGLAGEFFIICPVKPVSRADWRELWLLTGPGVKAMRKLPRISGVRVATSAEALLVEAPVGADPGGAVFREKTLRLHRLGSYPTFS